MLVVEIFDYHYLIIALVTLFYSHIKNYRANPDHVRLLVLNFNRILFAPGWTINEFPAFANTCSVTARFIKTGRR